MLMGCNIFFRHTLPVNFQYRKQQNTLKTIAVTPNYNLHRLIKMNGFIP